LKIGIILTPDVRSRAYLQKLIENNISIQEIILMDDGCDSKKFSQEIIDKSCELGFDISFDTKQILKNVNLPYKIFPFININHPLLVNYIRSLDLDFVIFSGGGILKHEILNSGVKFIHLHPGIIPSYRGSTCFYYSILNDNNCGVTAFIMDKNLDTGDIIIKKIFPKPNYQFIDELYDAHIRSETLIEIFNRDLLILNNFEKQDHNKGQTYFIIHPVLKHLAILNCLKK
jgi:methionyl-tRNA formyltransferase